MLQITNKTMLSTAIVLPVMNQFTIGKSSSPRKQYWRMTIKSSFEDAGSVEDMMLYTELEAAVHAMIQRLEYSFTFNPSLLTSPKRKQQVAEILKEAETYIWRIKEEMRCA